jgi:hypothetical protein
VSTTNRKTKSGGKNGNAAGTSSGARLQQN